MNQRTLYVVEEIPLNKERVKGADSRQAPVEIRADFTFFSILYLDGQASLSFSLTGREDYFDLRAGMYGYVSKGTKSFFVTNPAQEGKKLVLFLGHKNKSEVIR